MKRRTIYGLSFIIPILTMLTVIFALKQYPFSDSTINSGDFKNQYLPLYIGLKNLIQEGNWTGLFWSFSKSLGGTMTSVWGFNSISPFTMLYSLFPVEKFSIATVMITLLRYGFAGLAMSHLLIRRYQGVGKRGWLTVIFSVIYALSGFMVAHQINPNFLDNLVYLPLIVLSLEALLEGDKRAYVAYPLLLAMVMFTQFYTAYMICIFIVFYGIYYLAVRVPDQSLEAKAVAYVKLGGFSILGAVLAAFWLLPVVNALLESKASANETFEWSFNQLYSLELLFSKFFVGSFDSAEWGSADARPQLFMAAMGFVGCIHFYLNEHIQWKDKLLTGLFMLFWVFCFTNDFADKIWHMGQRPVGFYFRNAWLATLFLLLTAYRSVTLQYRLQWKQWGLMILVLGIVTWLVSSKEISYLQSWQIYVTLFFWLLISLSFVLYDHKQWLTWALIGLTVVELGVNAKIGQSRSAYFISNDSIDEMIQHHHMANTLRKNTSKEFFRMEVNKRPILANLPFIENYQGISHFTSSLEFALIDNLGKLGLPTSTAFVNYTNRMPFTDAIFAVKYFVDNQVTNANQADILNTYHELGNYGNDRILYQNDYALGLGFLVPKEFNAYQLGQVSPGQSQAELMTILFGDQTSMMEQASFSKFSISNLQAVGNVFQVKDPTQERSITLHVEPEAGYAYYMEVPNQALGPLKQSNLFLNESSYLYADRFHTPQLWGLGPGPDETEPIEFKLSSQEVSQYDLSQFKLYRLNVEKFKNAVKQKQADNLKITSWSDAQIDAEVDVKDVNTSSVFTSIPYNSGWKVSVDGHDKTTYRIWDTFLGFDLNPGHHQIRLIYQPVGFKLGMIISLVGWVTLIYLTYIWLKNK